MTNKPMLSVERELLERLVSDVEAHNYGFDGLEELRAILEDQYRPSPVKLYCNVSNVHITCNEDGSYTINPMPAAQRQGNPVAGHCTHPPGCKSCSWCGFKAEQPTQVHPNNSALLGLVQSNISIDWRGFYHLSGIHPDNFKRALDASGAKLTSEVKPHKSAVAVVMPSRDARDDPDDENVYEESYAKGWNEALDEVARLNGVAP